MNAFTAAELTYLASQPLMRFATASPEGKPDVAPVVFEVDGDESSRQASTSPEQSATATSR